MILPRALQQVINDNTSGSVTLLRRMMTALENELLDPGLDPATFISYIEHLRRQMKMFTVIRHFCDELILSHNISVKNYPANYLDFIHEYKEFWEQAPQLLLKNLQDTVNLKGKKVMLHSNSGTIIEVFRLLSGQVAGISVFQSLSAPHEEGRIQATELADMGYPVTLFSDAMAAAVMKDMDYLLLAADQVRRGIVINKTGSLQMALAAKQFNIPVLVLTESRKINRKQQHQPFRDEQHDPEEILEGLMHKNIKGLNYYFEEVPTYLVTRIITEKKVTGGTD